MKSILLVVGALVWLAGCAAEGSSSDVLDDASHPKADEASAPKSVAVRVDDTQADGVPRIVFLTCAGSDAESAGVAYVATNDVPNAQRIARQLLNHGYVPVTEVPCIEPSVEVDAAPATESTSASGTQASAASSLPRYTFSDKRTWGALNEHMAKVLPLVLGGGEWKVLHVVDPSGKPLNERVLTASDWGVEIFGAGGVRPAVIVDGDAFAARSAWPVPPHGSVLQLGRVTPDGAFGLTLPARNLYTRDLIPLAERIVAAGIDGPTAFANALALATEAKWQGSTLTLAGEVAPAASTKGWRVIHVDAAATAESSTEQGLRQAVTHIVERQGLTLSFLRRR